MAKNRSKISDHSYLARVTWLHRDYFDFIVSKGIQTESPRYRLIRDSNNAYDKNAVSVYVNQFKVGYLDAQLAKIIAPLLDDGHVFRIVHEYSFKGNNYEEKYDNDYGDGFYRELRILIYDELEIASTKGVEIATDLYNSLRYPLVDASLNDQSSKPNGGCIPIVLLTFLFFYSILTT